MTAEPEESSISIGKILFLLVFVSCGLTFGVAHWQYRDSKIIKELHFHPSQEEPHSVIDAFLLSIAADRTDSAKKFVVEEKWEEMEIRAQRIHLRFEECSYPTDSDLGNFGVGRGDLRDSTYSYSGYVALECDGNLIKIEGHLDLIKIKDKWFIHDWTIVRIIY